MYPNHWRGYEVKSDQPASDGQFRSIVLSQSATERTCKSCDYTDISTKGHTQTRTVYDVDKFGNRINITVELQEYRCKVCGKRFFGRLPSCVEEGSNISKDLAEGMVDDFLDTTTLAGSPAAPAIAAKYGVSAKTFSDALGKRIAKAKTQGIIAFVENYKYCEVKDILLAAERKGEKPFIVIFISSNVSKNT